MPTSRPAPATRRWWVIGLLGVGGSTALIVWWGLAVTVGAVTPQVTAYAVTSDSSMRLDYQVHRPEGVAVTCELTALDVRKAPVGTVVDEIPAGPSSVQRTVTLKTAHRAVTGVVTSCVRR